LSVCPSDCDAWTVAYKRYILPQKCLKKWRGSALYEHEISVFFTLTNVDRFFSMHAVWSGNWHDTVGCLSVCLRRCALWLNDSSYPKSVWTGEQKVPLGTRFYRFQPFTPTISLKLPTRKMAIIFWRIILSRFVDHVTNLFISFVRGWVSIISDVMITVRSLIFSSGCYINRIIIGSDRRPETKPGIEGKIDRFRPRRVRVRVRDRVGVRDRIRVRYYWSSIWTRSPIWT